MTSGIVYFSEIIESIKDATGIENMRPLYERIKRFVFFIEGEIGGGGLIVRKRLQLTKGDSYYDGKTIILPDDFVGEFSYGDLRIGTITGNILTLHQEGPQELDLMYMGFLLDEEGNPFTTRNHLIAVVAYAVYRLYSTKVFLKQGNANMYKMYQQEYYDAVLEARGNDAWPTEEDWIHIGKIMNNGAFEAFTDCGMKGFEITNGSYFVNPVPSNAICEYTLYLTGNSSGIVSGEATLTIGTTTYPLESYVSTFTNIIGRLRDQVAAWNSIEAIINPKTTVLATLGVYVKSVLCSAKYNYTGSYGVEFFEMVFSEGIGMVGFKFDNFGKTYGVTIVYNGTVIVNNEQVSAYKTFSFPKLTNPSNKAYITISSNNLDTKWQAVGICPNGFPLEASINTVSTSQGTLINASQIQGELQYDGTYPPMSSGPSGYYAQFSFLGLGVDWEVEVVYGPEDSDWLSVMPSTGNGNGYLTVIAGFSSPGANYVQAYRSAVINIRNINNPLNVLTYNTGMTYYPGGNNGYNPV